jgi:dsDNA-specific endonuclease/ATPase MutS2
MENLIKKILREETESNRYMFFQNLQQMKRQCEMLIELNEDEVSSILENGHDWAQDHIDESKNNMDQVFDFIMNEIKGGNNILESEITEKQKKNTPTNPTLWKSCLNWAKSRYKVCPSAYCNGAAVKRYNSKGGKWKKK